MPASSLTHVSSSVGTTSLSAFSPPAITSTGSSGVPAWWPFRDVRVVRDPNGMRLGTFLEELAEEEGARAAASSLDPVYHYQAVSPHIRNIMPDIGALSRPDTGYSMTNTPYLSEQGLYSNTPITTEV